MKIMHIITRLVQGGAQHNTIMCCAHHVEQGHETWLVTGPTDGPEGDYLQLADASGAALREVPTLVRSVSPSTDSKCVSDLRKLIAEVQPDVVHTHSSKAGVVGREAAWAEHVPAVIHTIHGLPFHRGNAFWRNWLYIAVERRAAKKCHKLIGITQAMCDEFQRRRIGKPEQFTVVHSGVDIDFYAAARQFADDYRRDLREKLGVQPDSPVIGVVARLDKFKGHDDVLNVMPRLRQLYPDLQLVFIGNGHYRATLETRVGFSSLQPCVRFLGLQEPEEVAKLMAALDVVVLPSYQEGQGRVLVEALLCGCAIVGYDVGGIGEVCLDGETGRLVKAGKWSALRDAIHDLLAHPEKRKQLTEQGDKHVREHFDARDMVEQVEAVYHQVLGSRGDPG